MEITRASLVISLVAGLIVNICCLPVLKGGSSGGSYPNAAPNFGSNWGAPSGQLSPGVVVPNKAPEGVSTLPYQPVAQLEPSVSIPAVQRQPVASFGSSVSSGPSGHSSRLVRPASSAHPGAAFQPGPTGINWALAPPSLLSGDEMSTSTRALGSSQPENLSPPGPMYQAGELSQYEQNFEHGNYETETEEQGYLPPVPAPMQESTGRGFTSERRLGPGNWGTYPYYDFMFLTGQYPPGTVTHSSSSYEQGGDSWQDHHYVRAHVPYNPGPVQQKVTFTGDFAAPQKFEAPRKNVKSPVMPARGHSAAQPLLLLPYGNFNQPGRSEEPARSQTRGF